MSIVGMDARRSSESPKETKPDQQENKKQDKEQTEQQLCHRACRDGHPAEAESTGDQRDHEAGKGEGEQRQQTAQLGHRFRVAGTGPVPPRSSPAPSQIERCPVKNCRQAQANPAAMQGAANA